MRTAVLVLAASAMVFVSACGSPDSAPDSSTPASASGLTEPEQKFVDAIEGTSAAPRTLLDAGHAACKSLNSDANNLEGAVTAASSSGLTDTTARTVVRVAADTICPAASAYGLSPSAPPATPVVAMPPSPAKKITYREWQLIAKNPAAHTGERVIVYGKVVQFDASTGTEGFRASVDGTEHKPKYGFADYDTNTVLGGDAALLEEVVQGDLFKAETTVAGAYSYETTMGGQLTVPRLQITKIDVIGHLD